MGDAIIARLAVGKPIDRYAKGPFLGAGTIVTAMATAAYGLADSVPMLVPLRILQGAGVGAFLTASTALISDVAPAGRRGEAIGYFGLAASMGMAVGPALGEYMHQIAGFEGAFVVTGLLALAAAVCVWPVKAAPIIQYGDRSIRRRFISRPAIRPALIGLTLFVAFGTVYSFLPLYVDERRIGTTGIFFSLTAAAIVASLMLGGRLSDRYGRMAVIVPAYLLLASSMCLLLTARSEAPFWLAAAAFGLAFGSIHPATLALTADRTSPARGAWLWRWWARPSTPVSAWAVWLRAWCWNSQDLGRSFS